MAKADSRTANRRWSARVTKTSDALDLKRRVFTLNDPRTAPGDAAREPVRNPQARACQH